MTKQEKSPILKSFVPFSGNETYSDFVSPSVMIEEICHKCNSKLLSLNKNDPTYLARKEYLENKMEEELDAVDSFEQNLKKRRKKIQIQKQLMWQTREKIK